MRLINFYTTKGGQGASVSAVLTATASTDKKLRTLLIDWNPYNDITNILSLAPAPLNETVTVGPYLDILIANRFTDLDMDWPEATKKYDVVIVDVGFLAPNDFAPWNFIHKIKTKYDVVNVLVTRPCYLALNRSAKYLGSFPPNNVILLVQEPGRSLTSEDIQAVLPHSMVLEIPYDPRISRRVDAGLLGSRSIPEVSEVLTKIFGSDS